MASKNKQSGPVGYARPVYLVDGARTPFLRAQGRPGPFSAADLAVAAGRGLLARQNFSPENLDEVIIGFIRVLVGQGHVAAKPASHRHGIGIVTLAGALFPGHNALADDIEYGGAVIIFTSIGWRIEKLA